MRAEVADRRPDSAPVQAEDQEERAALIESALSAAVAAVAELAPDELDAVHSRILPIYVRLRRILE